MMTDCFSLTAPPEVHHTIRYHRELPKLTIYLYSLKKQHTLMLHFMASEQVPVRLDVNSLFQPLLSFFGWK